MTKPFFMENPIDKKERKIDWQFHIRRVVMVFTMSILYGLVSFHRTCPTIVVDDMAKAYNVSIADLNLFTAVFFYPYGLLQPINGLLADIIEPAFLTSISQIIAAIGAAMCGFGNSMFVGCIGRFLTGIGCSPVYVPACRMFSNWYELKWFPLVSGVLMAVGGLGSLLAQAPLAYLCSAIGWRNAFYVLAGITFFFSLITLIFVRGTPTKFGYHEVNHEMTDIQKPDSFLKNLKQLKDNFLLIIKNFHFWVVAVFSLVTNGPYYALVSMWISPYLVDIFNMTKEQASTIMMYVSIGCMASSIILPLISDFFNTRKYVLLLTALIGLASTLYGYIVGHNMSKIEIIIVFLMYGFGTMPVSTVSYSLVKEYYHSSVAGSAIGCLNFLTMFLSGFFQPLCSAIIKNEGTTETGGYTEKGYKNGIWLVNVVCMSIAVLSTFIFKESDLINKRKTRKTTTISLIENGDEENISTYKTIDDENEPILSSQYT